jgi:biopolymer transport protein ExbD/biopolymer transport protein TolR
MQKKKAPPPVSDINVTPMVDVMLVLLIIFMVITPMLTKSIPLDQYKAKNSVAMQDADKDDAVIVAITRDGTLYLSPGKVKTNADQLPQKVRDLIKDRANKTVYVKADARARYEKVEDVVDNLRAAGIDEIGLLTEQLPPGQSLKPLGAPGS